MTDEEILICPLCDSLARTAKELNTNSTNYNEVFYFCTNSSCYSCYLAWCNIPKIHWDRIVMNITEQKKKALGGKDEQRT